MLKAVSALLASYPFNPVILAWTLGGIAAFIPALWTYLQFRGDERVQKRFRTDKNYAIRIRLARIGRRFSAGRLVTAIAFSAVGLLNLAVRPTPLPDDPAVAVRSLLSLALFLWAEWMLIQTSWANLRDRRAIFELLAAEATDPVDRGELITRAEHEAEVEALARQVELLKLALRRPGAVRSRR